MTRRGVAAGAYPEAAATVGTIGCLMVALVVVRATPVLDRERCADAVIWIGAAVAVTAWAGVAWRLPRFVVLVEQRVWRGSGSLTYPNAVAALVAALALLALALLVHRPAAVHRAAACYLLLTGLGATLSRAGLIAFAAGLLVLAPLVGVRATLGRLLGPGLGALIAVAALAPSFPVSMGARPGLAVTGLAVGAMVALGPGLLPGRVRPAALAVLATAAAVAAIGVAGHLGTDVLRPVLDSRATLGSYGRSMGTRAAIEMFLANPVAGTGVGRSLLMWGTADGHGKVALYVHDEYLQALVDLGVIGAGLLLALLVTLARVVRAGRSQGAGRLLWPGAVAALVALAVHSGFDFLWHIPVLPLLGGLLIGLAGRGSGTPGGRPATGTPDPGADPGSGPAAGITGRANVGVLSMKGEA